MFKVCLWYFAACVGLASLSFVDVRGIFDTDAHGEPLGWQPTRDCPHCQTGFAVFESGKYDPAGVFVCRQCGAEAPADAGFLETGF